MQKPNKDVIQGPFLLFVIHVSNIIQSPHRAINDSSKHVECTNLVWSALKRISLITQ